MALINCKFRSEILEIHTEMTVIIPQPPLHAEEDEKGQPWPDKHRVLYLLHGLSDDHTTWTRQTSIERYANDHHIAVVMPAVNRSFYADMQHGAKYWTFITEEVPALAQRLFPISARREDNFVAGLSMGGYGAFKLALNYPERFAAAASLSGALDVASRVDELPDLFVQIHGDINAPVPLEHDVIKLLEYNNNKGIKLPRLYQCCGTEDFLYEDNIKFRDLAHRLHIPLTYEEGPGDHNWAYWDMKIQDVLHWMLNE